MYLIYTYFFLNVILNKVGNLSFCMCVCACVLKKMVNFIYVSMIFLDYIYIRSIFYYYIHKLCIYNDKSG